MRTRIDTDRCTGHGRCYDLVPEVFVADDSGYGVSQIKGELEPALIEAVRRAVHNCPEGAVILDD